MALGPYSTCLFIFVILCGVITSICRAEAVNSRPTRTVLKVANALDGETASRLGKRAAIMGAMIRDHFNRRQERVLERRRSRQEICYDVVGCFSRAKHSPLKKSPQSPDTVDTKFWLYTHSNISFPQLLTYGDKRQSIVNSDFDPSLPSKIIAHGFKGSGKEKGAQSLANALLKLENMNVIIIDWEKGAAGPSYPVAAANTQLIGRQLALLLVDMSSLGAAAESIHIIGFSLGAHVAGFAGRAVQQKGIFIGRITGLDPASPLFRQNLGSSLLPLNKEDARFVDVIHTDAARFWSNGFGLFKALGHVDYFPNGGHNQPGCTHVRASLLVSHFEGVVNSSVVCNHARAFKLFLETLSNKCQFYAFRCEVGHDSFLNGDCFPTTCDSNSTSSSCGIMGYNSEKYPARGPLYLVTRDSFPYCGEQLQVIVVLSQKTSRTRGYLQLSLQHGHNFTSFQLYCEFSDGVEGGLELKALSTALQGSVSPSFTPVLQAHLSYRSLAFQNSEDAQNISMTDDYIYIDSVTVADLHGNRWQYCAKETVLENKDGSAFDVVSVPLTLKSCSTL